MITLLNIRFSNGPNQYPGLGLSVVRKFKCTRNPDDNALKGLVPKVLPILARPSWLETLHGRMLSCVGDCKKPEKMLDAVFSRESVCGARKSGMGLDGGTRTATTSVESTLVAWY